MTAADVIQQTQHKMGVTVEKLRDDFTRIRTGRASTGLLDKIRVDYYGCPTPLNQVAQVGVGDAHTLTVQPWEKNMVKVCEKAKVVKGFGEEAKVAVRNLRRDANTQLERLEKDKEISEDDQRRYETEIQKLTDRFVADIDKVIAEKDKEIMTV